MADGVIAVSDLPNKEVRYVPNGRSKSLPLRVVSGVVTELSPLLLLLKYSRKITNIFYEEPEIGLHPQLQKAMGRVLCRIVNSGINVCMTTHSDLIIQHINNMIALNNNSENEEFVAFASEALKLVMISLPLQGIINIGTNYFQYISRARVSTILVVLRQIVLQIPLAILLPLKFNISGLWASYYIADVLIFLVIVVWLIKSTKMTDI